jgi:hypothetical protein
MLATPEVEKVGTSLMPLQWSAQHRALIVETDFLMVTFLLKRSEYFAKKTSERVFPHETRYSAIAKEHWGFDTIIHKEP